MATIEKVDEMSIGEVARFIGVSVPTLRSWELRYGWPVPVRTSGAHRRYPADELERLKKVAEMRRSMSVSAAIRNVLRG